MDPVMHGDVIPVVAPDEVYTPIMLPLVHVQASPTNLIFNLLLQHVFHYTSPSWELLKSQLTTQELSHLTVLLTSNPPDPQHDGYWKNQIAQGIELRPYEVTAILSPATIHAIQQLSYWQLFVATPHLQLHPVRSDIAQHVLAFPTPLVQLGEIGETKDSTVEEPLDKTPTEHVLFHILQRFKKYRAECPDQVIFLNVWEQQVLAERECWRHGLPVQLFELWLLTPLQKQAMVWNKQRGAMPLEAQQGHTGRLNMQTLVDLLVPCLANPLLDTASLWSLLLIADKNVLWSQVSAMLQFLYQQCGSTNKQVLLLNTLLTMMRIIQWQLLYQPTHDVTPYFRHVFLTLWIVDDTLREHYTSQRKLLQKVVKRHKVHGENSESSRRTFEWTMSNGKIILIPWYNIYFQLAVVYFLKLQHGYTAVIESIRDPKDCTIAFLKDQIEVLLYVLK